ncbi:MAG: hypothetical protein JWM12_1779 [Ilumatobacteraceae bacterium]|nr:hypothetical protein [Ilumatobacteraceae bacterium]
MFDNEILSVRMDIDQLPAATTIGSGIESGPPPS